MSTIENAINTEMPDDIEALLPWHAAGTLSPRDAARVERALANDPELARRYAMVRDELGETIVLNETLGAPSTHAMDNLFAKIDAEPVRRTAAASVPFATQISSFIASLSPRTLSFAGGLAVVLILLQAGFIASTVLKEQSSGGYVTASAPSTNPGVGAFTLIRFAPQATQDDVTKFLEANKFAIAAGPLPGGLYRVRVGAAAMPKADLAAIVKKMQEDKSVGFAAATE